MLCCVSGRILIISAPGSRIESEQDSTPKYQNTIFFFDTLVKGYKKVSAYIKNCRIWF